MAIVGIEGMAFAGGGPERNDLVPAKRDYVLLNKNCLRVPREFSFRLLLGEQEQAELRAVDAINSLLG